MRQVSHLTGHTMRVLFFAASPDGQTVVTGAGDETLRFWSVFPKPNAQQVSAIKGVPASLMGTATLR